MVFVLVVWAGVLLAFGCFVCLVLLRGGGASLFRVVWRMV